MKELEGKKVWVWQFGCNVKGKVELREAVIIKVKRVFLDWKFTDGCEMIYTQKFCSNPNTILSDIHMAYRVFSSVEEFEAWKYREDLLRGLHSSVRGGYSNPFSKFSDEDLETLKSLLLKGEEL